MGNVNSKDTLISNKKEKGKYWQLVAASLEDIIHLKEVLLTTDIPEGPVHHSACNDNFHSVHEVTNSQQGYNWKVVDPFSASAKWESWASFGLKVPDPKYEITWTDCADRNLAFTGVMVHKPGQVEPLHHHSAPMIYYILQGRPVITLNGIKNRASKWQCVSIPSFCPHSCYNDTDEGVVIAWTYLTNVDSARPKSGQNMQWKFLEPGL